MKYSLMILTIVAFAFSKSYAQIGSQIPQHAAYYHSLFPWDSAHAAYNYNGAIGASKKGVAVSLYPVGTFNAPAGKITHIYVAGNASYNYYSGEKYSPSVLCMGQTTLSNFDSISKDTTAAKALLSGLQRVVVTDSLKCVDSALFTGFYPEHNNGIWVKIELDQPFIYDPGQSLILAGDINVTFGEGLVGFLGVVRMTRDSTPHYMGGIKHFGYYYLEVHRDTNTGRASAHKIRQYVDFGFDIQPASVDDAYPQYAYRVYPNPAREVLHIEGMEKIGAYEVYDLTGRLLIKSQSSTSAIPVSMLPTGMYLVRFVNGETPYNVRFQKE